MIAIYAICDRCGRKQENSWSRGDTEFKFNELTKQGWRIPYVVNCDKTWGRIGGDALCPECAKKEKATNG